jgi:hypothetical protein
MTFLIHVSTIFRANLNYTKLPPESISFWNYEINEILLAPEFRKSIYRFKP